MYIDIVVLISLWYTKKNLIERERLILKKILVKFLLIGIALLAVSCKNNYRSTEKFIIVEAITNDFTNWITKIKLEKKELGGKKNEWKNITRRIK